MARHRAQHRLKKQRPQLKRPQLKLDLSNPVWHLYWILPLAATVLITVFTVTFALTPPEGEAEKAATASALPRVDPTTTETARAYLDALGIHKVALEPHQAVFVGHAVCEQRKHYNASLATLQKQLREWVPDLRPIDAATLVDDADKHLCPES